MAYLTLPPEVIPEIKILVNLIMSFTPLISYGSTVLSIRRNKSSKGFSMDICATMLIASTLRIFYYFNDPFEISLLRQCIVMIFIQVILLRVALKYRPVDYSLDNLDKYESNWDDLKDDFININKTQLLLEIDDLVDNKAQNFTLAINVFLIVMNLIKRNLIFIGLILIQIFKDFLRLFDAHYVRPFKFWQWRSEITYWKFLISFLVLICLIQLIFNGNEYLGITLGSASFLVESSLPLPQILMFNRVQTVENFKTILLLSWLGGDLTKISYLFYGTNNVTLIFIIAAFFQMSLNLIITYQFFHYKKMDYARSLTSSLEMSSSPIGSSEFDIPMTTTNVPLSRRETRITSNPPHHTKSRSNTISSQLLTNIQLTNPQPHLTRSASVGTTNSGNNNITSSAIPANPSTPPSPRIPFPYSKTNTTQPQSPTTTTTYNKAGGPSMIGNGPGPYHTYTSRSRSGTLNLEARNSIGSLNSANIDSIQEEIDLGVLVNETD